MVVLAFQENHAKRLTSNFSRIKSYHQCTRVFEINLLNIQSDENTRDELELYVLGKHKTNQGSYHECLY